MNMFWRKRPPTEAELLAQISRSIRIAYGPTPWWMYVIALTKLFGLAYTHGFW